jgi:predicted phosphodiesterase
MYKDIIFVGDIHGQLSQITYYQKIYNIRNSLFVQVGDFGIGFLRKEKEISNLKYFNDIFKNKNNVVYAIRGNHDDPTYFIENRYSTSNIKLIQDYTILDVETNNAALKMLFMGGGTSLDRTTRKSYITGG